MVEDRALLDYWIPALHVSVVGSQTCVGPQHWVHAHSVWPALHSGTHWLLTIVSPHGHTEILHLPLAQVCPLGHEPVAQVPPQPSGPPQVAPAHERWHWHWPLEQNSFAPAHVPQAQVPPQSSDPPQVLP